MELETCEIKFANCHEAGSRVYNNCDLCCTCTNNSAMASSTVVTVGLYVFHARSVF